jgi:hypothetical protein
LYNALCNHNASCGSPTPAATCVTQLQSDHSCNTAVGLSLDYDQCLAEVNAAACSAATTPAVCNNVILSL